MLEFFVSWNGVGFFRMPTITSLPDLLVVSDPAGALGFGAICGDICYGTLLTPLRMASITVLELFPVVVATFLWGSQWLRLQVEFLCDNEAIVAILNS